MPVCFPTPLWFLKALVLPRALHNVVQLMLIGPLRFTDEESEAVEIYPDEELVAEPGLQVPSSSLCAAPRLCHMTLNSHDPPRVGWIF